VRDAAAEQAIELGMKEQSARFLESGAEVYAEPTAAGG
jgi:hypothetical protein